MTKVKSTSNVGNRFFSAEHDAAITKLTEDGLKQFKVPGIAVVVFDDKEVLWQRGFGYADVARKKPVTADTLFMLASISKSLTVSAMHAAAARGLFDWDKPVRQHIPDFKLMDDRATLEMTPRDLVSHRSGLPRHDYVWLNNTAGGAEMVGKLRYLQPNYAFRSKYQYQNLMYMTAGYFLSTVTGASWAQAVSKYVLKPLGLKRTTTSLDAMLLDRDHALGYTLVKGKFIQVPHDRLEAMGPTGGVISSMVELAQFGILHLRGGEFKKKQILSAYAVAQMQTPHTVMKEMVEWPEVSDTQYGMGWFITHYRGRKHIHHGGNLAGFSTLLSFLPDEKIGVALAMNISLSSLRTPLTYSIYDQLLDLSRIDWYTRFQQYLKGAIQAAEDATRLKAQLAKKNTKPSRALTEFAGIYDHPAYGRITITLRGNRLILTRFKETVPLTHIHYDVFQAVTLPTLRISRVMVMFDSGLDGYVSGLKMPLEPSVPAIQFLRCPSSELTRNSYLKRFIGQYSFGEQVVEIIQINDCLMLRMAPAQQFDLIAVASMVFRGANTDSLHLRFSWNSKKREMWLTLIQNEGATAGKRTV